MDIQLALHIHGIHASLDSTNHGMKEIFFFFFTGFDVFLAVPCGLWDLSSLTRPWQWKGQALTIGLLGNPPSNQKKKMFNSWKFRKAKLELANSGNYCLNIHIALGIIVIKRWFKIRSLYYRLYANTTPFYIGDLSMPGFWYPYGS